jgi:hypothetical protein
MTGAAGTCQSPPVHAFDRRTSEPASPLAIKPLTRSRPDAVAGHRQLPRTMNGDSRPISDIHNPTNEVTNQTVAGCCDKSGSGMVIPVIRSLDWLDSGSRSVPMSQGPTGVQDSADRGPVPQKPPLYCPRWLQEVGVPPNSLRTFSADAQRTTAPQRNGSAAKRQVTGRQPLHRTEVMGQRVRPRAARPPTSPRRHGRPKRARLDRTR